MVLSGTFGRWLRCWASTAFFDLGQPSQAKPICRQVGSIIAPEIVYAGVADLNAAATATLFCDYPSLRPPPSAELSEMRALTAELREDVAKLHEVGDLRCAAAQRGCHRPQC